VSKQTFSKNYKKATKNLQQIHDYWKNPSENNLPEKYFNPKGGITRSNLLVRLVQDKTDLKTDSSIFELGCNIGRNLWALQKNGYVNLHGVEINQEAVKKMSHFYPNLSEKARIVINSIEDWIETSEAEFDLVFTMAVLEHIHNDSEWIFPEISKITKNYLITIEDEKTLSSRHFPRNYQNIFEKLGMKQIFQDDCKEMLNWKGKFFARVFQKIKD